MKAGIGITEELKAAEQLEWIGRRISRTSGARFGGTDLKEIGVSGYEPFVEEIKDLIHKKQYQVLKLINAETINLYWEIGEEIH